MMSSRFPPEMKEWEGVKERGLGSPPSTSQPSLARPPSAAVQRSSIRSGYFEQAAGVGLGVTNLLAEHILSHPCVVVRRQCQINVNARSYHTTPFTLFGPLYNLQQQQGIACLWKGVTSSIIVQGVPYLVENGLQKLFLLPRQITNQSKSKDAVKHILLKTAAFTIATPFYAAAFIETVQSSGASDCPAPLEFVNRAFSRIGSDLGGRRDGSRRLPFWLLAQPTAVYRLSHYLVSELIHYFTLTTVQRHIQRKAVKQNRTVFDRFFPDLFAAFSSRFIADSLFFPIETVLHRLYSQGTRVLFDNMDTGLLVASMDSRYEGFWDCARSIYRLEGFRGFYKGFGALVLQYAIYYAIIRLAKFVSEQLEEVKAQRGIGPYLPPSSTSPPLSARPSLEEL